MTKGRLNEFVAECFWPGVTDHDLGPLDDRARAAAAQLTGAGRSVHYVGSLLVRVDEVVLCLFQGAEADVRAAAELAAIPFERVLETVRSPWPACDGS
jgi:hypothetical protein